MWVWRRVAAGLAPVVGAGLAAAVAPSSCGGTTAAASAATASAHRALLSEVLEYAGEFAMAVVVTVQCRY